MVGFGTKPANLAPCRYLLRALDASAGGNPGALFQLALRFERTDGALTSASPARVRLELDEGAPFAMTVPLAVQGGTASPDNAALPAGSTDGTPFTIRQCSPGQPARFAAASLLALRTNFRGLQLAPSGTLLLLASSQSSVATTSVDPTVLVEGGTATVAGSGFSASPV